MQNRAASGPPSRHYLTKKIVAAVFVPGINRSGDYDLWVTVGTCIEFYSADPIVGQSEVTLPTGSATIAHMVADASRNVWIGLSDGSLRVYIGGNIVDSCSAKCLSGCVSAMAIDKFGVCWVGDILGGISVVTLDEASRNVEAKVLCTGAAPTASTNLFHWAYRQGVQSSDLPVHAILCGQASVIVAGGSYRPDGKYTSLPVLTLWDGEGQKSAQQHNCNPHGPCHALACMGDSEPYRTSSSSLHGAQDGSDPQCRWQMLSGHENGRLLLWDVLEARMGVLMEICVDKEPVR